MKAHVTAPAPRFLLRLFVLRSMLAERYGDAPARLRACEIGPGLGDVASYVASTLDIDSLDLFELSEKARKLLCERFSADPRVRVHGEFVPRRETHDLALCFEVIEHVEDDAGFLAAVADSLRPGGTFIGSVPAHMSKWQAVDELAGHYRRYGVHEMREKLAAAGLTDIEIRTYGFPLINLLYPLRHLYYSRALRERGDDTKAAATIRSGTARGASRPFNTSLVYGVARAFDLFRHLPGTARLDDGLVFSCRKR